MLNEDELHIPKIENHTISLVFPQRGLVAIFTGCLHEKEKNPGDR
jgi:hypothetical protein